MRLLAGGLDAGHLVAGDLAGKPAGISMSGWWGPAGGPWRRWPAPSRRVDGTWTGRRHASGLGVGGVADLAEDEVGGLFHGQRRRAAATPSARREASEGRVRGGAERASSMMQRTVGGSSACRNSACRRRRTGTGRRRRRGGKQVTSKPSRCGRGIETGDALPAHGLHLMRDRDAGDGRAADVVIGDQEGAGHRGEHPDLVTGLREVRPDGGSISQTISKRRTLMTATLARWP